MGSEAIHLLGLPKKHQLPLVYQLTSYLFDVSNTLVEQEVDVSAYAPKEAIFVVFQVNFTIAVLGTYTYFYQNSGEPSIYKKFACIPTVINKLLNFNFILPLDSNKKFYFKMSDATATTRCIGKLIGFI